MDAKASRAAYILHRTRDLLSDPIHWTQIAVALDGQGSPIDPLDPAARVWSLQGALRKYGPLTLLTITAILSGAPGFDRIDAINATATHKGLLAILDHAILFASAWA